MAQAAVPCAAVKRNDVGEKKVKGEVQDGARPQPWAVLAQRRYDVARAISHCELNAVVNIMICSPLPANPTNLVS